MEIPSPTKVAEKGNDLVLDVQVPHSIAWLAPFEVKDLILVGWNRDGGYVLSGTVLRDADVLISMGLGADWQLEKDARLLNHALRVHVYDHTVCEKLFTRQYIAPATPFVSV